MRQGPLISTPRCRSSSGSSAPWTSAPASPFGPGGPKIRRRARDQAAALLPVIERVSGAEHPDTLRVRGSLAAWTGVAGDWAAARDQFAALLPACERISGAEHPDTLSTRADLAAWTGVAGDWAVARDQFAALLPVIERISGAEHPDILSTRASQPCLLDQASR